MFSYAGDDALHEETGPTLLFSHIGLDEQPQADGCPLLADNVDGSESVCPSEDAFDNLTGENYTESRLWDKQARFHLDGAYAHALQSKL